LVIQDVAGLDVCFDFFEFVAHVAIRGLIDYGGEDFLALANPPATASRHNVAQPTALSHSENATPPLAAISDYSFALDPRRGAMSNKAVMQMTDPEYTVEFDGKETYVMRNGVRLAMRCDDRWVSIEPGVTVRDVVENGQPGIEVRMMLH